MSNIKMPKATISFNNSQDTEYYTNKNNTNIQYCNFSKNGLRIEEYIESYIIQNFIFDYLGDPNIDTISILKYMSRYLGNIITNFDNCTKETSDIDQRMTYINIFIETSYGFVCLISNQKSINKEVYKEKMKSFLFNIYNY